MNKCDCYHIQPTIKYKYNPITGDPILFTAQEGVCWGTKEMEICSCGGDRTKCDFYPNVRERALEEMEPEFMEPEFGEWISVKDRLPEKDGEYLCIIEGSICIFDFTKDLYTIDKYAFNKSKSNSGFYDFDRDLGYYEHTRVTHWMPLPEPPKGE